MGRDETIDDMVLRFYSEPGMPRHVQYLVGLRFLYDGWTADEIANEYGLTVNAVYSIVKHQKERIGEGIAEAEKFFFAEQKLGRPQKERDLTLEEIIVDYRKKYLSIPEIKVRLDALGYDITERTILRISNDNGFANIPKRSKEVKDYVQKNAVKGLCIEAPEAVALPFNKPDYFTSKGIGVLFFLPFIKAYGIDKVIRESSYPGTQQIGKVNSILAFLALKLANISRYSHVNGWCFDRSLGLFAGLNVLPKASWFSTYSSKTERKDNVAFMNALNRVYAKHGLLSDTVNLDFTAIPYWGDEDTFENNWSGKRSKALISIQAALAQDPEAGILCYGDATVKHDNQDNVVLEFMDFYRESIGKKVAYLVFDSKFTTYENLGRIDKEGIIFVTIQRRSKRLVEKVEQIPKHQWKTVTIEKANHKSRTVTYSESTTTNALYGKNPLRQIFVKGRSIKPAVILTNDFKGSPAEIIKRYSRRWLVETEISEQIHFFHLNRNCSGIVVKVDFDLTMTLLAHNLNRLLALGVPGYSHHDAQKIFNEFIDNHGSVLIEEKPITVKMAPLTHLPLLRESLPQINARYEWLGGKKIIFSPDTHV
jgi:transposase